MTKLAIVGSASLAGNKEAVRIIRKVLDRWNPELVISGGAVGIDTMAIDIDEELGLDTWVFLPKAKNWINGYRPRNLKIANACDALIRIVSSDSKTYGSGWTRDRASEMGKHTEEYVIKRRKQ